MRGIRRLVVVAVLQASSLTTIAAAAEPNETFETATTLGPGVLLVSDELRQGPDTLLGSRNFLGGISEVDDDSSTIGNGFASALAGVSTNNGVIRFAVTGVYDGSFAGAHDQSGEYEVFVQPYDFFGDPVGDFSVVRSMTPGVVEEFAYFDEQWIGGSYDVTIDNTSAFAGFADADFFTFTGLTPGATFSAETFDPTASGVDTLLGWFSSTGFLEDSDDNGGVGDLLSKLTGVVPANGQLTLAVSGANDVGFIGDHTNSGAYDLKLTLGGAGFAADFNDDGKVNAADLVAWKEAFGKTAVGDADNDNDSDGADFLVWQWQYGSGGLTVAAASAVPEPTSALLMVAAAIAISRLRQPPR